MAGKTTTRVVTYLGRRAERTVIQTAGPASEREIRMRWIDDQVDGHPAGTVTSRTVKGDFTRGTGVVLIEEHVVGA